MAAPEIEAVVSIEREIAAILLEPDSFSNLVDSLLDCPSKDSLKVWGAIRGFYPPDQLPVPSASDEPGRTYPHPATHQ